MATETQLEIIGYLINQEDPLTIRGIARNLGKSYPLVYNNIEDLHKKEIIYKKNVPPAHIISLNYNAPVQIFIEAETKRKEKFLKINKWLHLFQNDIVSSAETTFFTLLIFGSYAKNKQTSKSDLDILVIVPEKKNIKSMETAIKNIYTKTKKHCVVVNEQNFLEMIRKPNQFSKKLC